LRQVIEGCRLSIPVGIPSRNPTRVAELSGVSKSEKDSDKNSAPL
jgi:hypothetical protein